jgi:hypothetical protein
MSIAESIVAVFFSQWPSHGTNSIWFTAEHLQTFIRLREVAPVSWTRGICLCADGCAAEQKYSNAKQRRTLHLLNSFHV